MLTFKKTTCSKYDTYSVNGNVTIDSSINHNGIITNRGSMTYCEMLNPPDWLDTWVDFNTFNKEDWLSFNDYICKLTKHDNDYEDGDSLEDLDCWAYICLATLINYEIDIPERNIIRKNNTYYINSKEDIMNKGKYEMVKCIVAFYDVWKSADVENASSIPMENELITKICNYLCECMKRVALNPEILQEDLLCADSFPLIDED